MAGGEVQKMVLDDGAQGVVVQGGITVEFNTGSITLNIGGSRINVDNQGWVEMRTAANDAARLKAAPPRIGDLHNRGIYVGLSATTGKPLYAAPADQPRFMTYNEALESAEQLKAEHPTAHVPTPDELEQNLFANRFIGELNRSFNTSGSFPTSAYRSSGPNNHDLTRVQYFDKRGTKSNASAQTPLPVRLVW